MVRRQHHLSIQEQHRKWAGLEKRWMGDAYRDRNYLLRRAAEEDERGNSVLAEAYMNEANVADSWGTWRANVVGRETWLASLEWDL